MDIHTQMPMKDRTTLRIGGNAEFFTEVSTQEALREAVIFARARSLSWRIIGSGSNILCADEGVEGLTIKIAILGMEVIDDPLGTRLHVGAGVVLDELVAEVCARGIWGLENLSAIPGTVGATPIQNVGAYGVEVADVIVSVTVYDTMKDEFRELSHSECRFTYRHSLFKEPRGQGLVITRVTFFLPRALRARIAYYDLAMYARDKDASALSPYMVREAVREIRSRKFPDFTHVGTAGSFFKNPIISPEDYQPLLEAYPALIGHSTDDGWVKIPLGWILDHVCGLRGVREGNVGTYPANALALVNYGGATAREVNAFAEKIATCVKEKTGIVIEREVTFMH